MATNKINVLLIEDNPGDVRLVQEALHESKELPINLIVATSMSAGLKCIATEVVNVILLDLNLPDSQGIHTFKQVNNFAMHVPIIIMSVLSDKELIYEAMRIGALDYLIKGKLENDSVIRTIRYAMWSCYHPA